MNQHTATFKGKLTGGALVAALASGALAMSALSSAPTANATCASFFGIGNTAQCTSNLTSIAIAIGTNAQAHAVGLFGAAFSVGTNASAATGDAFTFATAAGDGASATATGVFGLAAQFGRGESITAGSGQFGNVGANIAISVAQGSPGLLQTYAAGFGNVAINLFGNASGFLTHSVTAQGIVNIATNIGGNDSHILAGGSGGNVAFNAFGSGNIVSAGPGPVAIAGSIGQTGQTVKKVGPGFNINGFKVGGAAAVGSPKTATPTAAVLGGSKKTPAAAAATGRGKR